MEVLDAGCDGTKLLLIDAIPHLNILLIFLDTEKTGCVTFYETRIRTTPMQRTSSWCWNNYSSCYCSLLKS